MSKIVVLPSFAKEYLIEKFAWRRTLKYVSAIKFFCVLCVLLCVAWLYAFLVTSVSTRGYELEQVKDQLAEANFQQKIHSLDIVTQKKKLRNDMNLWTYESWFVWHGSNIVTVNTYSEYVYAE